MKLSFPVRSIGLLFVAVSWHHTESEMGFGVKTLCAALYIRFFSYVHTAGRQFVSVMGESPSAECGREKRHKALTATLVAAGGILNLQWDAGWPVLRRPFS